ncbi:UDP-glucose 6-dehydrogenase [Legionella wadsworthii]|uniref:UDP-glucose 6-dehydrogenase n=1 Tax=Legionella wadsworthii TaxID=28088 RepID=A0A378LSZ1_9GAMM|nr:UDP-glucose/GDP-mannose dehydrogenase family protein [Legionella wadsworthii]STY29827.1 UDP-glucose 6-dehydrogenase [Legionella wadsworthii]
MNISVYGAGYVGLVSAACLAHLGHEVVCTDIDIEKIDMLQGGGCPLHEKHLNEILEESRKNGKIFFSSDLSYAISRSFIHIITTGTPSKPDGSADLSQVFAVSERIASEIKRDAILVIKSTVPAGTCDEIYSSVQSIVTSQQKICKIDVVSNPEFLREGNAVTDFLNAERIIAGGNEAALIAIQRMYQPLLEQGIPLLRMSRRSAELTKYAANAMLACKISFINQMSRIAEVSGANIDDIRLGIGYDRRIGKEFFLPGVGYGGSCFPKDVRALCATAKEFHIDASLIEAIESVNNMQKNWAFEMLEKHFTSNLEGRTIGIWGLAFKQDTDDLREASSLNLIYSLLAANAQIQVYDPEAMKNAKKLLSQYESIRWCESASQAVLGVDALVIVTEWSEFKYYPLYKLASQLKNAPLIDGRNCYNLFEIRNSNIHCYYSVGRPAVTANLDMIQVKENSMYAS